MIIRYDNKRCKIKVYLLILYILRYEIEIFMLLIYNDIQ